jgi:excinuclease ABC subunit A
MTTAALLQDDEDLRGRDPNIERRWRETDSAWVREELSRSSPTAPCETCGGYRLKPEALAVKINGLHIGEVTECRSGRRRLVPRCPGSSPTSRTRSPRASSRKSASGWLSSTMSASNTSPCRASGTLSGGESQRIRLASQIGSGLTGVLYVLDEPSIGLHQRDNAACWKRSSTCAISATRDRGRA